MQIKPSALSFGVCRLFPWDISPFFPNPVGTSPWLGGTTDQDHAIQQNATDWGGLAALVISISAIYHHKFWKTSMKWSIGQKTCPKKDNIKRFRNAKPIRSVQAHEQALHDLGQGTLA
ncbi:hypothetical protein [Iodidimonas gelatinilytica]|uniref:hypothetical protein n=1 Tax=Iodidimonas gelatinilytica TaxID=1236966 RepID=UPI00123061D4|nr:hypothetical protein [Iodidimonas gelatinilytica]